ncbi:MAG TPA: MFS transporter [Stellaceae bacterium]|jgi:predicted MFS family arabinose efflux permease|nr:MFS transporter [Stellaceae bacterium]
MLRLRLAVILCGLCGFLDLWATQALLPFLADELHASALAVSFTVSMPPLAIVLVAPWIGVIADVLGRRRVIIAAMFGLVIPTVMVGYSTTLGAIIFWRFVQGLFVPPIFATTVAYIADEAPPGQSTAVTGVYTAASVFGGFLSRFLSAILAEHFGWRDAFLGLAVITLLFAIGTLLIMPKERGFRRSSSIGSSLQEMLQHFRDSRLVATYCVGFCVLFTLSTIFTFVGFHLAAPPYALSTAAIGSLFLTYLAGVVTTSLVGRGVAWLGRRRMVLFALLGWGIGIAMTLLPSIVAVIAGLAAAAAFCFVCQAASTSYVALTAQRGRSSAVGLYVTAYYLGGSVGGPVAGTAWTIGGWGACVACALVVLAAVALVVRRYWVEAAGP